MKSSYPLVADRDQILRAVDDLSGFNKTVSILYLGLSGLPILDGIIITRLDDESRNAVMQFVQDHGFSSLLLRQDKNPESPPYPMGGYLVPVERLFDEAEKFFSMGRIVVYMEPYS